MARAPKTPVAVAVPEPVRELMCEVDELIADEDDAVTVESDDLLQSDRIYGGLHDAETKRFGFRYFHDDKSTWDINLDARQIAEIASGQLNELHLWKCADRRCACLYATENSYCMHCDSIRHFDDDYPDRLRRSYPEETNEVIESMANLRRVVLAILDYQERHDGLMPPVFLNGTEGRRLHSWRSAVLPFLDEDELFESIDFARPWDSPLNAQAALRMPDAYASPHSPKGHTRYVAALGETTLWPINGERRLSDVTSGYSYTIVVVESPTRTFRWMEPNDLDVETLLTDHSASDAPLLAGFADGHVEPLRGLSVLQLRELLTI